MITMKRLLTWEVLICAILGVAIMSLSLTYLAVNVANAPSNTYFPLVHNYNTDYNFYLHLIKQSQEGQFTFTTRYTPESAPYLFLHPAFLLLGKIGAILHLDPPLSYTFGRIAFGIFLIFFTYRFIRLVIKDTRKRMLAFFFSLFASGFWTVSQNGSQLSIIRPLTFWTELDILDRFVY